MSLNTFSIGRDCQLVVIGPAGRVDLTHVTAFESRQITHSVRVDRLDGTQVAAELPKGWEGSFEVERGNSAVDDFIAGAESQFYSGNRVPSGTLYQYVTETDGSTSTFQYDNVVFKLVNAGQWKGDISVKQKLDSSLPDVSASDDSLSNHHRRRVRRPRRYGCGRPPPCPAPAYGAGQATPVQSRRPVLAQNQPWLGWRCLPAPWRRSTKFRSHLPSANSRSKPWCPGSATPGLRLSLRFG